MQGWGCVMPVFECRGCPGTKCILIVEGEDDCAYPDACQWGTQENLPVWREMKVSE
jgi:hypothetical protein